MKRVLLLALVCFSISGSAYTLEVTLKLKGSYFYPSEDAFKDIYGGGMMYGGEVTFRINKNIDFWLGSSYFSKQGKLTFTEEETTVKIIPAGGGVKYISSLGGINYYSGLGLNYYHYKESNPIGLAKKGGLGIVGKIGAYMKPAAGLIIDLFINYSYCKMQPADYKINIGGLETGVGIGYVF